MSNEQELRPGRELDALIAKKVFGINVIKSERKDGYAYYTDGEPNWDWIRFEGSTLLNTIPHYSTDISAAWEIVEKYLGTIGHSTIGDMAQEEYVCELFNGKKFVHAHSFESAPHAICLAALKLVENT